MIEDVDETLREVVTSEALNGSDAELAFDAPTKEWAARRNRPTVDLYLYDIREDLARRDVAYERVLGRDDRVVDRRPPPRRFELSYLVTAWTKRPEDEHRLLSLVLSCFLRYEVLPEKALKGTLADQPVPVLVRIALPPSDERSISDLWTALGGDLKPSLDLVVVAPFDTSRAMKPGPPVLEEPRVRVAAGAAEPTGDEETIQAGTDKQPGRTLRVRVRRE
jgi:Pvc16 N-terminal domain